MHVSSQWCHKQANVNSWNSKYPLEHSRIVLNTSSVLKWWVIPNTLIIGFYLLWTTMSLEKTNEAWYTTMPFHGFNRWEKLLRFNNMSPLHIIQNGTRIYVNGKMLKGWIGREGPVLWHPWSSNFLRSNILSMVYVQFSINYWLVEPTERLKRKMKQKLIH